MAAESAIALVREMKLLEPFGLGQHVLRKIELGKTVFRFRTGNISGSSAATTFGLFLHFRRSQPLRSFLDRRRSRIGREIIADFAAEKEITRHHLIAHLIFSSRTSSV